MVKESACLQKTHEMWDHSLGWGDPLEEEMATHSSILAWKVPGTEEPGGIQSVGSQGVGHEHKKHVRTKPKKHIILTIIMLDKCKFCWNLLYLISTSVC